MSIIDRPDVQPAAPTLPASAYRDPTLFERERRDIFAREWLLFGRSDQLPDPGDLLSATIIGYPVIVVRQPDGSLRGFHNVCRHRAAMLTQETTGSLPGGMIRCPYHSWTYGLDGCLNRAPGFGAAVEPGDWSLFPIAADEWRGLVFIRIATTGPSLLDWLGPIVPLAAHYPLENQRFFMEKDREVAVDWKVYGENYLECYHCPNMHPGLCEALDISRYTIDAHAEHGLFHLYGPKRDGSATDGLYFYRFPYLMLNFYQWGSSIATLEPLGAGRVRHINWYLFSNISPERAEENRRSAEWSAQIVTEDLEMTVGVQRNLAAGIYDRGILSPRQERAVKAFQDMVRAALPGVA
jgi:phenylpropionate dioxygenase-like ring-hydroxylating dioxygenase large terminal subunit